MEDLSTLALEALKRAQEEAAVLYDRYNMKLVVNEAPASKKPARPPARKPASRKKPAAKAQLAAVR